MHEKNVVVSHWENINEKEKNKKRMSHMSTSRLNGNEDYHHHYHKKA